ncbi:MAG: zinc-binding dehydrogenase [Polyangiales bacterium]
MTRARAAVIRSVGRAPEVVEVEVDDPAPGDVLVRVLASGVCHTDLLARDGAFGGRPPLIVGHEGAGVVEAVGRGVTRVRPGDRVVLTWRAPCSACRLCLRGQPARCLDPAASTARVRERGGAPLARTLGLGTLCTHTVVAEGQVVPLGVALEPIHACLLGCAVATGYGAVQHVARLRAGAAVAVFGCGGVGCAVIQAARLRGAGPIVAVDIDARRLELARALGATVTVDATSARPELHVRRETGGAGAEVAFECSGSPDALTDALASCEVGGTCVMIGVPPADGALGYPMARFFQGRRTLTATVGGDIDAARDLPRLAALAADGLLDLGAMVSRTVPLDDVGLAFEAPPGAAGARTVVTLDAF